MPKLSSAVTVIVIAVPAVAVKGAATTNLEMAAGLTVIAPVVPVTVPVPDAAVSIAVTVWLPAVFNVTEKLPAPFVSVTFAGSAAWLSVLVKRTVPAYPVTVFPDESCAVTDTLVAVPAVAVEGDVTTSLEAAPALTVIVPEVPLSVPSVTETVALPTVFSVTWKVPVPPVPVPPVSAELPGSTAAVSVLVIVTVPA